MPKHPRETDDPFGAKLLQVLRETGHEDDLNYLAEQFGVRVQSTYDWIKFGRMATSRYARLVEWSGRSLNWWFDVPAADEFTNFWPFKRIALATVRALDTEKLAQLEVGMVGMLAAISAPTGNRAAA